MTKTIMLVHGAWLNSKSWEGWKARFESKGYSVTAPDWPHDEGEPADLRAHPREALTRFGPKEIVASYASAIEKLPEAPILIGHSAGGVWVQHLLERGLGAAGVAINPAPTPGVGLGPHAVISALPVLGDPLSSGKVVSMTPEFFGKRFANGLPESMKDDCFKRYVVPTAGKVLGWRAFGRRRRDPLGQRHAPALAADRGRRRSDASMTHAIYEKQKRAASATEYKLYASRSHFTCIGPRWEEVADFALDWAVRHAV